MKITHREKMERAAASRAVRRAREWEISTGMALHRAKFLARPGVPEDYLKIASASEANEEASREWVAASIAATALRVGKKFTTVNNSKIN